VTITYCQNASMNGETWFVTVFTPMIKSA